MSKSNLKLLLQGIILGLLYAISGRLCVAVHAISGFSSLVWVPSGIGLAALVLLSRRLWPFIFFGGLILNLVLGRNWPGAIGIAAGNAFESWLGAVLLLRFCSAQPTFTKVREVGFFVSLVMGLSCFLSSGFEISALYWTGGLGAEQVFRTWRDWWLGESLGNLIIGAAIICWHNSLRFRSHLLKLSWNALLLSTAIILTCIFVYTPLARFNTTLLIKPYFLFSLMVWAAIRYDVFGVIATNLVFASTLTYGALLGFVSTNIAPLQDRMVLNQFFFIGFGITGYFLAAAIREKQEAVDAKSDFLSIASHELKTPITSLSLQIQLAQRKLAALPNQTPAEINQLTLLKKVNQHVARLVSIVNQLLDVSRIERRDITLQLEEVHLSALIQNTIERLSSDLANAGSTVHYEPGKEILCTWDPFRFEQVLENIFSNAIKYAPKAPISIETILKDETVEIIIRDYGPGIEEAKQNTIFERFVRANATPNVKGLGLGLFISRQIVQAHGGEIWATGKLGEGTRFHILMPLIALPSPTA